MQAVVKQESEELIRACEELFQELDKGIRDMEKGRTIPHDEFMKQMYAKYGALCDV